MPGKVRDSRQQPLMRVREAPALAPPPPAKPLEWSDSMSRRPVDPPQTEPLQAEHGSVQGARRDTLGGILGGEPGSRPSPSAAWSNPATLHARLSAVVEHQNQLRVDKQLPLLGGELPTAQRSGDFSISMPNGFDGDETTAGLFSVWGDQLMRAVYGDLFSLNQVYSFEGDRLASAVPYAQWLLERLPGDTVQLHRQMGPAEEQQWRQGALEGLGSGWGHTLPGGATTPVVHFSTDAEQTSAAGEGHTLTFTVFKAELLAEAKRGALWSSATELPAPGTAPVISELVLPASTVQRLAREGKLSLDRD